MLLAHYLKNKPVEEGILPTREANTFLLELSAI